MALHICQNPQKFTGLRANLNVCKFFYLERQGIPGCNAKCDKTIQFYYKFIIQPYWKGVRESEVTLEMSRVYKTKGKKKELYIARYAS